MLVAVIQSNDLDASGIYRIYSNDVKGSSVMDLKKMLAEIDKKCEKCEECDPCCTSYILKKCIENDKVELTTT